MKEEVKLSRIGEWDLLISSMTKESKFPWFKRKGAKKPKEILPTLDASKGTDEEDEFQLGPSRPSSTNIGTWHPASDKVVNRDVSFTQSPMLSKENVAKLMHGKVVRNVDSFIGDELIKDYKKSPSEEKMEHLFAFYEPRILDRTIRSYSSRRLPEPAIRGRVYNNFLQAIDRYDPKSKKSFHMYFAENGVRGGKGIASQPEEGEERGKGFLGMSRWANRYANFASTNSDRSRHHGKFQTVGNILKLQLGREANAKELAKETGFSLKDVKLMQQEVKSDLVQSRNLGDTNNDMDVGASIAWQRARDTLSVPERRIADAIHKQHMSGEPLIMGDIAKQFGKSASYLSRFNTKLGSAIRREQRFVARHGV